MSKQFAEQIIDSMVDENGHCGDRALSAKQFLVLSEHLCKGEEEIVGGWNGNYKTIDFTSTDYEGNIGKYHVILNEFWHFHVRYTVVSIDLRDADEYQAELDAEARLKAMRDFSGSEWVSQPKKRIEFELTLVNDYVYDGYTYSYYDSGVRHIYTFRDAQGNCIVWKTSNPLGIWVEDENGHEELAEAEIGDTVTMKATVKEHGEYKDTKQTVITRPKIAAISKAA